MFSLKHGPYMTTSLAYLCTYNIIGSKDREVIWNNLEKYMYLKR